MGDIKFSNPQPDLGAFAPLSGEETIEAVRVTGSITLTSGFLRGCYFKAKRTEAITSVMVAATTASSGTAPTLCRIGVWAVNSSDWSFTSLVASTANDVALYATQAISGTDTPPKALQATWNKTAGTWYAVGALCVTAGTAPQIGAVSPVAGLFNRTQNRPGKGFAFGGQTDLPSSASAATAVIAQAIPYFLFIP